MNRLFNHNDVFAGLNVHDAEIRYAFVGVLLWLSRLRIWCCHCCGLGHCCGMSLIPGSGTSTFHECGKEGEHSCFGCFGGKNYTFFKKKKTIYAAPATYGSSWARGRIRTVAEGYTTATATPYPSHICDLCCSLQQYRNFNPMSKARDQTHILTETTSGP